MSDIVRGLCIVLGAIVVLALIGGIVTVVGAGVGLVWVFLCRVVPIILFCLIGLGVVVGGLKLIGLVARKLASRKSRF